MLAGHIDHPDTYKQLLTHPVWGTVVSWLTTEAASKEDGEYEISGRDIYASVSTVETLPRDKGIFEAHKEYIDVHYCVEGDERIEWLPVRKLGVPTEENTEKDYALFSAPKEATSIHVSPGTFTVFFPEDAHMPKLKASSDQIRKVVVKVNTSLLS